MPCNCHKNRQTAETSENGSAQRAAAPSAAATNPLACRACLDKHLGTAAEYAKEAEEEPTRMEEYRRAIGHMVCAEDHARALGLFDFAASIRSARKTFQETRKASEFEAILSLLPQDGTGDAR